MEGVARPHGGAADGAAPRGAAPAPAAPRRQASIQAFLAPAPRPAAGDGSGDAAYVARLAAGGGGGEAAAPEAPRGASHEAVGATLRCVLGGAAGGGARRRRRVGRWAE
jgi:hypothetical protein